MLTRQVHNAAQQSHVLTPQAVLLSQGRYFEAVCTDIDPVNKEVTACYPNDNGCAPFTLHYDMLVIGVSSSHATGANSDARFPKRPVLAGCLVCWQAVEVCLVRHSVKWGLAAVVPCCDR
jgi:hypothetical protein